MKKVRRKKESNENVNSDSSNSREPTDIRQLSTISRASDDISRKFRAEVGSDRSESGLDNEPDSREQTDQRSADASNSESDTGSSGASLEPDEPDDSSDSEFGTYRGGRKRVRRRNSSGGNESNSSSSRENRASAEGDEEISPRVISFDSFKKTKGTTRTRKSKSEPINAIKKGLDTCFSIPIYLHWGRHWELSQEDAQELAEKIYDSYKALPPSQLTKWIVELLEKSSPFVALAITAGSMIYPRYLISQEMFRDARTQQETPGASTTSDFGGDRASQTGNRSDSKNASDGDKVPYGAPLRQSFGKIG